MSPYLRCITIFVITLGNCSYFAGRREYIDSELMAALIKGVIIIW